MMKIYKKVLTYCRTIPQDKAPEKPQQLNLITFIQQLDKEKYEAFDLRHLEILCKKIEVVKKIFLYYDLFLKKPTSQEVLPENSCNKLVCHLLLAFIQTNNYKFCNSVLKIQEGILVLPHYKMPVELNNLCENIYVTFEIY